MTKVYPYLFLFLIFGSLILGPLFIINTPQIGFHVISRVLAEESSEEESSDSGDDDEKEADDQSDDDEKEADDQSDDDEKEADDQSDAEADDQSDAEADEETCTEPKETEAETEGQKTGEPCENPETDEEADDQSEEKTEQKAEETEAESTEETQETPETKETQNDETSNSNTDASEPTVLDAILSDDSLLKQVVDDNATEPVLASALTVIQEDLNQPATETCGNEADDDGDGIVDEDCAPTTSPPAETCANETDDDGDGAIDEEDCVVSPAETCANETDDDGDGTIDEEDCVIIQAEICDNGLDDDADGKIDAADEDDCSVLMPAVVIASAEDEEGEPLSRGDLIVPGEVTFTFSAEPGLTLQGSQADSQDYEFECALDDESFNSCNSPMTYNMEAGKHDFVVKLVPLT